MNQKLKILDYDSDDKEDNIKDKQQNQKEPQKYSDINEDDDIIMCSLNLPFEPIKENDEFKLKLTDSPLFHTLYKVIKNEKNIKWFGSLKNEKIYTQEEREEISNILKEKNMYLINVKPEIYEKTKILFNGILEPLCHYITLDENSMDTYVNFSDYWKEYKKYIDAVCTTILPHISKKKKTLIFLHDYYFFLFPTIFINKCNYTKDYQDILSNISMGLYIHISFPSHEIFKRIPTREEIIASLIKCQVLGFHTFDHSRNFLKTSKRLLGANFVSTVHGDLAANYLENTALIRVKNVTPEIDIIKEYQKDPKFQQKYNEIINKYKDKIIFLAMDHLFFPITIKNKLVAFKRFLSANVERANKVVFLLIVRDEIKGDTKVPESMEKIIKEIKDEFGEDVIDV
jgi:trehalose-6-phosphate synthase